jgi:hypothetical protein
MARVFVEDDVFHERAGLDGIVDIRFLFGIEVDAFGVTAAFKIEDAPRRPAVFVGAGKAVEEVNGPVLCVLNHMSVAYLSHLDYLTFCCII